MARSDPELPHRRWIDFEFIDVRTNIGGSSFALMWRDSMTTWPDAEEGSQAAWHALISSFCRSI
jgi:hypothetical protein